MRMAGTATRTLAWEHLRGGGDAGVFVTRIKDHSDNPPHDHVFHEIVSVEAGTAEHQTVDGLRKLRPGDLIVIRPQVWHAYVRPRGLSIVNCLVDPALLQKLAPLLSRFDGAFDLLQRRAPRVHETPPVVLHASPAERAALRDRFDAMLAEQRERRNGWQAATTASLLDVLVAVLRMHAGASGVPSGDPGPATTGRVEQAVLDAASYLESHYTEQVSLEELARRVHLSAGHLSRHFTRRMGMGVVEYLHRMRAEEACRLLRCTDEPITEIALRVGYREPAYFSRCFRAQIGQSAQQYRRGGAAAA